ncbi:MAG: sugar nucleotide-binding protein [Spirochaetes bacterium]|nr:sugar nucleotide-binding protein [Spirochaetota bacterium]
MILISGSDSYLTSRLIPYLRNSFQVYAFDDSQGSIMDEKFIKNLFLSVKPKYFINLKEKTDIIDCEFQKENCYNINALALKNISKTCKDSSTVLIQLSSSYLYGIDNKNMLTEDMDISAYSVYADSKLLAEKIIQESGIKHLSVRSGERFFENGTFLNKIAGQLISNSEICIPDNMITSPVSSSEICSFIKFSIDNSLSGIYNCSCTDYISVYDFSVHFLDIYNNIKKSGLKPELKKVDFDEYLFPADVPQCNRLSVAKLKASGYTPENDIFSGIENYINSI